MDFRLHISVQLLHFLCSVLPNLSLKPYSHPVNAGVYSASQLMISASKKHFLLVDIGQREYNCRQKVQSSRVVILQFV
jgi:hypothetical protein